jgi:Transglycosylase SLT domain
VRALAGWVALVLLALAACRTDPPSSAPLGSVPQSQPPRASPTPTSRDKGPGGGTGPLPSKAAGLAHDLTVTDRALARDVARWRRHGSRLDAAIAGRVLAEGLRQQRIYRLLASRPLVSPRVEAMVSEKVARELRANIGAARDLASLVTPLSKVPRYEFAQPAAPTKLRRFYGQAEARFGVPWYVLAAINFVESKFGRIVGPSSAGALGPMQFLPSTFAAYGRGDIRDPHDSIMAAARYLHADGAPERLRAALFAYNRAGAYVDAILRYARQMHRNRWSFWAYYGYQVFVSTTGGSVRLTGPGTAHPDQTPGRPAPT